MLKPGGLAVVNWLLTPAEDPETQRADWVYPDCVFYEPSTGERLYGQAKAVFWPTPWPHPGGLRWDVVAARPEDLPSCADLETLASPPLTHT